MVGAALALAGSGFFACFNPELKRDFDATRNIEVLSVNGTVVSMYDVNFQRDLLRDNFSVTSRPDSEFWHLSAVLVSLVTDNVIGTLAREKGVMVDDGTVLSLVGQQVDSYITSVRQTGVAFQELKPDAVESEFQEYFKKQNGVSTREFKDNQIARTQELLDDEHQRQSLINEYSRSALQQWFVANTEITDEEAEASYEQFEILTMMFLDQDLALDEREAKAEEALAELEAGADFVEVMKKYSENPVTEPGTLTRADIDRSEGLQVILDLEAGQHSEINYEFVGIPIIYKLVSVTKELPDDYEDTKDIHKDTLRQNQANQTFNDAVAEGRKTAKIKWSSKGHQTVYELTVALGNQELEQEPLKAYLRKLIADDVRDPQDPMGPSAAIYSRYVAMKSLDNISTVEERNDAAETFTLILIELLTITENVQLRLDLVELYERMELMDKATDVLREAARMNTGFLPINDTYYDEINRTLTRYETEGKIEEGLSAEILALLTKWSMDKAGVDHDTQNQLDDLDEFTINPATGKLLSEERKEEEERKNAEAAEGKGEEETGTEEETDDGEGE